jgi:hypothetical protein
MDVFPLKIQLSSTASEGILMMPHLHPKCKPDTCLDGRSGSDRSFKLNVSAGSLKRLHGFKVSWMQGDKAEGSWLLVFGSVFP